MKTVFGLVRVQDYDLKPKQRLNMKILCEVSRRHVKPRKNEAMSARLGRKSPMCVFIYIYMYAISIVSGYVLPMYHREIGTIMTLALIY